VARCVVAVSQVARDIGFADAEANKIATAASELARNILKYAGKGELLVEQLHQKRRVGVAVFRRNSRAWASGRETNDG
jgi:serine/threonine-protein kinase RsbT